MNNTNIMAIADSMQNKNIQYSKHVDCCDNICIIIMVAVIFIHIAAIVFTLKLFKCKGD